MQIKAGSNENQMIQANFQTQEKGAAEGGRKAAKQQKRTVIFAGDLSLHKDPITIRRREAQRQAMKFVQNAWDADRKIDKSMNEIREQQEIHRKEEQMNREQAQALADKRIGLREQYGVDSDSQEQKDLELLIRATSSTSEYGDDPFTEEEKARLAELREQPLTEYQERCLSLYNDQLIFERRKVQTEEYYRYLTEALIDMEIERLKSGKMTNAQNNAKKVMEEAGKDIQGMLMEEAKDHVDETYEETREEAEEKAEEKEEEEKKIELRKEQKELMEARTEAVREESQETEAAQKEQERDAREEAALLKDMAQAGMDVSGSSDSVKAEIKDILNKMKLIEADIKGIEVDEEI
mgnify:FL=1